MMTVAVILLPIWLFLPCLQRFVQRDYNIMSFRRERGWLFLDRMSFDCQDGYFSLRVQIDSPTTPRNSMYQLALRIVPDHDWQQEFTFKCARNVSELTIQAMSKQPLKNLSNKSLAIPFQITSEDKWASEIRYDIAIDQSVTLHFILVDCQKQILSENWRRQSELNLQFQVKNGQLQHDYYDKINIYFVPLLVILTATMTYYSGKPINKQFEEHEYDWARLLVFVSLLINLVATVSYGLGFLFYISFGGFSDFFDCVYLLLHSLSEVLLTSLIMFISYGWTVSFIADAQFDFYIPLLMMLGILNLLLTVLSKINDGSHDKYHMYDSIPAFILVGLRIATLIIFMIGCLKNMREYANYKSHRIFRFFIKLACLGLFYFLYLPMMMMLARYFPSPAQKQSVFIGVELGKNFVNFLLTYMVNSQKSNYSRIKMGTRSFMEQGDKLL